jgi:large subunit ribosomal protein L25
MLRGVRVVTDTQVPMSAVARSDFGKGAARRLRRTGLVPAVIYGHGTAPIHVALDGHDLVQALKRTRVVLRVALDGTDYIVAPRDVQRDVVRQVLEHVDLVVIDKAEAAERAAVAAAIARAEAAAEEEGVDISEAIQAIEAAVAAGEDPQAAAEAALHAAAEHERALREAASNAADAAEAAEAAEGGAEGAEAGAGGAADAGADEKA